MTFYERFRALASLKLALKIKNCNVKKFQALAKFTLALRGGYTSATANEMLFLTTGRVLHGFCIVICYGLFFFEIKAHFQYQGCKNRPLIETRKNHFRCPSLFQIKKKMLIVAASSLVVKEFGSLISIRHRLNYTFTDGFSTSFGLNRSLPGFIYFLIYIGELFFESNMLEQNNKLKILKILEKNWVLKTIKMGVMCHFLSSYPLMGYHVFHALDVA